MKRLISILIISLFLFTSCNIPFDFKPFDDINEDNLQEIHSNIFNGEELVDITLTGDTANELLKDLKSIKYIPLKKEKITPKGSIVHFTIVYLDDKNNAVNKYVSISDKFLFVDKYRYIVSDDCYKTFTKYFETK